MLTPSRLGRLIDEAVPSDIAANTEKLSKQRIISELKSFIVLSPARTLQEYVAHCAMGG